MQQTQNKQVQFTLDNIDKCQCLNCPVQHDSSCAMDKAKAMQPGQMPQSQSDVPKVYCSQGTAACDDLDFSQRCICPTCAVWAENGLDNYKYCQNGPASQIG
jgi:hypothetical protein